MENENATTQNSPQAAQAVDHLILAFEKSGMRTFTEAGPDESGPNEPARSPTMLLTVRAATPPANGTVGPVMRFIIEASSGKILSLQIL